MRSTSTLTQDVSPLPGWHDQGPAELLWSHCLRVPLHPTQHASSWHRLWSSCDSYRETLQFETRTRQWDSVRLSQYGLEARLQWLKCISVSKQVNRQYLLSKTLWVRFSATAHLAAMTPSDGDSWVSEMSVCCSPDTRGRDVTLRPLFQTPGTQSVWGFHWFTTDLLLENGRTCNKHILCQ